MEKRQILSCKSHSKKSQLKRRSQAKRQHIPLANETKATKKVNFSFSISRNIKNAPFYHLSDYVIPSLKKRDDLRYQIRVSDKSGLQ